VCELLNVKFEGLCLMNARAMVTALTGWVRALRIWQVACGPLLILAYRVWPIV
jgi:hypothetical protein